jgi:hypothetical protein
MDIYEKKRREKKKKKKEKRKGKTPIRIVFYKTKEVSYGRNK